MRSGLEEKLIDPEQFEPDNKYGSSIKMRTAGKHLSHQDHDKLIRIIFIAVR
jgi:hypothetical protein